MKSTFARRPAGAVLVALLTGGSAAADSGSHALEGTWRVRVTTKDCSTGTPLPAFRAVLTFGSGGILTGTTSAPLFKPGQRTPDHGTWARTGPGEYRAVSEAFILFDSPAPPIALQRGAQRIAQAITMDGDDRFASEAAVQFLDVDGNVVARLCATAAGDRFE